MRLLNTASWGLTLLLLLCICVFFTHKFPYQAKSEYIKEAYFYMYVNSHSRGYLLTAFESELRNGSSVVNDYLIAEWLIENKECAYNGLLATKLFKYKSINQELLIKDDSQEQYLSELYWLSYLNKQISQLNENCNY
mgnify:CR=1 FL=1